MGVSQNCMQQKSVNAIFVMLHIVHFRIFIKRLDVLENENSNKETGNFETTVS